jgi:hypothetical protein
MAMMAQTDTTSRPPDRTGIIVRAATLGALSLLGASAALLWWHQGSEVFLETLAAGFAWCF